MGSRIFVSIVSVFVVLAAFSGNCFAAFPKPDYYELYALQQGWYDGDLAWFTCTSTNSIKFVTTIRWTDFWSPWFIYKPDLTPKLSEALNTIPKVARPVYVVTNSNQAPVFDTRPGADDYSGLWQVFLVTWLTGRERDFTESTPTSDSNPYGLPDPLEAQIVETDVVVNCPILALDRLGGPWHNAPEGGYRIAQGLDADPSSLPKWILLPHYTVYVTDVLKSTVTADIAITDAADENFARLLGANYAPRLALMPPSGVQNLWLMNGPMPPSQLPIIEEVFSLNAPNTNSNYTPIAQVTLLDRHIPAYVTVPSGRLFKQLLENNLFTPDAVYGRINMHVGYVWWEMIRF